MEDAGITGFFIKTESGLKPRKVSSEDNQCGTGEPGIPTCLLFRKSNLAGNSNTFINALTLRLHMQDIDSGWKISCIKL